MIDQHKFEYELYQCLNYGDEKRIAAASGKSASYYSQMFNPEDPRESIFFRAAQDFANWAEVDRVKACEAFRVFRSFVEPSLVLADNVLCLHIEHARSVKESADTAIAHLENKPLYTQLKEVDEDIAQKRRLKAAIIEAINAEKETGGSDRFDVRQWARKAVAK